MINKEKFELSINSALGYLTKYYSDRFNKPYSEMYPILLQTETVRILRDKNSRLFLEDITLIIDALEIERTKGKEEAISYLYKNIGG